MFVGLIKINKQVKIFLLDVNCTDEATHEIADSLKHSMNRLLPGVILSLSGQCTDSGGGGTKYALQKALTERYTTWSDCLVSTFLLHNLHTYLINAVTNVLGEGGMNKKNETVMNVLQMLHGAYIIQN